MQLLMKTLSRQRQGDGEVGHGDLDTRGARHLLDCHHCGLDLGYDIGRRVLTRDKS